MIGDVVDASAWLYQWWGSLAWLVMVTFLAGTVAGYYDREHARRIFVAGWVVLAVLWLASIYQFVFDQKSITQGLGVILGVPVSLYVGYLLASGRDGLLVVSRAVGVMWAVYLPLSSVSVLRDPMIEMVTHQTAAVLSLLTGEFTLVEGNNFPAGVNPGPSPDFSMSFVFQHPESTDIVYTIILACTGLGSIAIFAGLIAAVKAPIRRKLKAFAAAFAIIYVLNILRNVFIAYTFGLQKLQIAPETIASLFSLSSTAKVSYFVSDRIISQFLTVVALVGITYIVIKLLPEVLTIVEEALYVVTRDEYDLRAALDIDTGPDTPMAAEARADGGAPESGHPERSDPGDSPVEGDDGD